ncbi:unnamed protein product [Phaedon cochleariae]|uniref:Uncharacterized protein n=1 Tax=Phaedon cochleariae TaxID=80249 RepID=A0A9N9SDS4_PHACE|nr:unnamed protein product [Phaedon cochleariae]
MFDNPIAAGKKAETKLAGLLATNNLPFSLMDVLTPLCKDIFPDSKIAQELALQRTKATQIVRKSIAVSYKEAFYDTIGARQALESRLTAGSGTIRRDSVARRERDYESNQSSHGVR